MHEVEFDLEPRDVEAWYFHHAEHSGSHRFNYLASGLIVSGILVVATDRITQSTVLSAFAALAGFGMGRLLGRTTTRSYLRFVVREQDRAANRAAQYGTHFVSIDATGITMRGPASQHRHEWTAAQDMSETPEYLFFTVAGGGAYIVPRRAFSPPEKMSEFRTAAANEIAKTRT